MFKPVSNKLNIAEKEKKILDFWEENKIFEKSLELKKDSPLFAFYEGPPTANGKPGIHHVMSRTVKDAVCRYKTMKGFLVDRKAGWDTHGLPVEIEVEKSLNLNGKDDIEKLGIAEFNKQCKNSVFHYKKEWDDLTKRIGYWLDLTNPYITFTNDYIESVWWILKELWKKDLLYQGFKILPYCPRCETPLSSHEVSQGYKDVKDPSIYVRMKQKGSENTYFLVWTTTPWTLISNVALAVNPDIEYVKIDVENIHYILAKERIADLYEEGSFKIIESFKGIKLEGLEYERLFDFVPVDKKAFYVILGEFVTTSDGTGIVHIAPAFGEDDYQAGKKYDLPVIRPVNKSGKFDDIVTDYKAKFVKDADEQIILDLKTQKKLIKKLKIEHSYPHCWRCDTPLLYYARESWFIKTSEYKDKLLANNEKINWFPPEVGSGRFNEWLKNNIDWSLSRDRYWGTPLNIWVCDNCESAQSIGSIEELQKLGQNVPDKIDLHKPYVDDITLKCDKCNSLMHRVPEVIDCWFDSGSMPYAQFHYPFGNKEIFDKNYPADFICEGIDQTRGWFYSLLAISTLLFDKPPFKNIIVNELILDKNGQKMSKSKGNAVVPENLINKYGADTIRWYLLTVSPPWTPKRFDEEGLKEILRKYINTLLNTYSFFVMYANIDGYKGVEKEIPINKRPEIDRWILSKLYSLVINVSERMENYDLTRAARMISDYVVDDVSNWYVRRNRRRFWKSGEWDDKLAAYHTLHEILLTIVKLVAPFTPFLAEDIFLNIKNENDPESVHFSGFPIISQEMQNNRDEHLESKMEIAQKIVSISHSLRNDHKIRVRQPLAKILVYVPNQDKRNALKEMEQIVCDELNVKSIEMVSSANDLVIKKAKPNFRTLGPKVGKLMAKIGPIINSFSDEQVTKIETKGYERIVVEGEELKITAEDVEILSEAKEGFAVYGENELTIALDLTISEELYNEGLAREIVNRIQNFRKEIELEVTDRIDVVIKTESSIIKKAIADKIEYIKSETLANRISEDFVIVPHKKEIEIENETLILGLSKSEDIR
jgi:isoleucyl-tRNA synthetase